ncbi:MAG: hypothetical protein M3547_05505 [Acidobacteriota bacterium]|nr:hypothetical protein [Acidobacteriota bacterium]
MAIGLKNAGDSEHVFAMWRQGGRRFWFQDQYVAFFAPDPSIAWPHTRKRFEEALREFGKDGDILGDIPMLGSPDCPCGCGASDDLLRDGDQKDDS